MHGDGSAKVSRKDFFPREGGQGTRNLGQHPYIRTYLCVYIYMIHTHNIYIYTHTHVISCGCASVAHTSDAKAPGFRAGSPGRFGSDRSLERFTSSYGTCTWTSRVVKNQALTVVINYKSLIVPFSRVGPVRTGV